MPPSFVALRVNGQEHDGMDPNAPTAPPGAVFVPVPNTPQTSEATVFGEDAQPIYIRYPNDSLPNFMIAPVEKSYVAVGAGMTFDKIAEVDDEGQGMLDIDSSTRLNLTL